jgi:hypothetical protein
MTVSALIKVSTARANKLARIVLELLEHADVLSSHGPYERQSRSGTYKSPSFVTIKTSYDMSSIFTFGTSTWWRSRTVYIWDE